MNKGPSPIGLRLLAISRAAAFAMATWVGILIIWRAASLPITIDEVTTLRFGKELSLEDLWSDANFHPLNSLWVNLAWRFPADHLILFRLPNVISGLFFIFITCKFAKNSGVSYWPCLWMIFLGNPFAIEFFSLARGYGIALGFTAAAFYSFLSKNEKMHPWAFVFSCGAILSNYSYASVIFPLLFAAGIRLWRKPVLHPLRAPYLWISGAVCVFVIWVSLKLKSLGLLYYGGRSNFLGSTLKSIADTICYSSPYRSWMEIAVYGCIGVTLAHVCVKAPKAILGKTPGSPSVVLMVAFGFSLALAFNGTFHVVERTALAYWLLLVFCFAELLSARMLRRLDGMIYAALLLALASGAHTIVSLRRMTSYNWGWDMSSDLAVGELIRASSGRPDFKVAVCSVMIPAFGFNLDRSGAPGHSLRVVPAEDVLALPDPNFDLMSGEYYGLNIVKYPPGILEVPYIRRYLDGSDADAFYLFDVFHWPAGGHPEGYRAIRYSGSQTVLFLREA